MKIENKLPDTEITKRLSRAFLEVVTDDDINEIYQFYKTSAGPKFLNSYGFFRTEIYRKFPRCLP